MKTKNLISASLLAALAVVLTRFFGFSLGTIRISLGTIPIMLSGIIVGPLYGLATGAVADLVGYLINPMGGAYFPGFTLTAALVGFLPGLILKVFKQNEKPSLPTLAIAIAITEILCHIFLNTVWVSMITGKAYLALLPSRVISRVVHYPLITGAIYFLLKNGLVPFSDESASAKERV